MNKVHFFYIIVCVLLISCTNKDKTNGQNTIIKPNAVSVIIDDQLWNGEVGDTIRNKFASPVLGLQEEEPIFTLNQFPDKLLEGYKTNSRNSIIIKKSTSNKFLITENQNKNAQITVQITGKTIKEIIDNLEKNAPVIIKKIKALEIKEFQKQTLKSLLKNSKITEKFKVNLNIPSKYKLVMQGKKFVWFKKEITSGNLSILVYQVPLSNLKDSLKVVNSIIKIRDSIGSIYIRGNKRRTQMITETAFSPYLSKTKIYGKSGYETKGTWDLKNDFMSGPFINYAIMDIVNNRVMILEGFCYAPSKDKRDLMLELESIIKSVTF